ncbi:MAG: HEAT repeat domain-containing protein [Candidatus Aminicenantes bacterium]|nr:HEAT repeat domain-containing protein [Candidatus Aminicenantes bacterium]
MRRSFSQSFVALASTLVILTAGLASPAAAQGGLKPLEAALKGLASFKADIDSAAYWKFRDAVLALRSDQAGRTAAEIKLLDFLKTSAPLPAKMAVCRELRLVGGPASVPVLERFLVDKNMSDPGRYALEEIPGPVPDQALLRALGKTSNDLRIGVISSLGFRKTADAVAPLAVILAAQNEKEAVAAAYALGRIGGTEAAGTLIKAFASPKPAVREAAMSSALACAETMEPDQRVAPLRIAEAVLEAGSPASIRLAAAGLKISASGDNARASLLELLKSKDEIFQQAAIAKIRDVFPAGDIGQVTPFLPDLPADSRIRLIAVLAGYPGDLVRPAILKSMAGSQAEERIAAMKALESTGDATVVPVLAETAARSTGAEQAAARSTLGLLKGRDVDEAVLALLSSKSSDAVKSELILAAGERRMFTAKSALMAQLGAPSVPLRVQSLKVLKVIGTPSDIPGLLQHLAGAKDENEREETENAAAVLARKIAEPIGRANTVKSRLRAETDPDRKAGLVRILGKIGDDSSLPDLRREIAVPETPVRDAAVRALADWPTAEAIEDVFDLAKSALNENHRLLALRGFIRMTALRKYRIPEYAVSDLRLALEMARRPEEKRLVLGVLSEFPCSAALTLAKSQLNNTDLAAEAKAAVAAIEKKLKTK